SVAVFNQGGRNSEKKQAHYRQSDCEDIRHELVECESQIEEVMRRGRAAKRRLCRGEKSYHQLERWYSLVMERDRLIDREDDLRLRNREIATDEEYRSLKKRFEEMRLDGDDEDEDSVLEGMVEALRKRGSAKSAVDSFRYSSSGPQSDPAHVVLERHGHNYLNFRPVFIA
ncbi:hypothetical protein PMAYCL1PPCAC_03976, partial [Pristionchus mayeri]